METTTPASATPTTPSMTPNPSLYLMPAHVQDNDVCTGHIQSQAILIARNNTPYLSVNVRVDARLNDAKRPQGPATPFAAPFEQSISVFLQEAPDRPWSTEDMERVAESLAGLGFPGDDLQVLDPAHAQHQAQGNLVGRKVYLRTYTNNKGQRVWVVKHFRPFETKPAGSQDLRQAQRTVGTRLGDALKKAREPFKGA
jgi:hypothetical protein